ncbi:MAG: hypothetical protein IJ642_01805 [Oscillospiraceae bacterium]|nr:hypothetical protein [Oscillospiraceae bacterium]
METTHLSHFLETQRKHVICENDYIDSLFKLFGGINVNEFHFKAFKEKWLQEHKGQNFPKLLDEFKAFTLSPDDAQNCTYFQYAGLTAEEYNSCSYTINWNIENSFSHLILDNLLLVSILTNICTILESRRFWT